MNQFDDLCAFKDWWLAVRPMNSPNDGTTFVADTHGVVLFRQEPYQVEMFLVKPDSEIPPHIHPNVDSFEVYISGDITFMCNGEYFDQNIIGDTIRVLPNSWHGGTFGKSGGCFLSIQKWMNGVKPKFVGDDWQDKENTSSYGENRSAVS